jgi:hypothetical protein
LSCAWGSGHAWPGGRRRLSSAAQASSTVADCEIGKHDTELAATDVPLGHLTHSDAACRLIWGRCRTSWLTSSAGCRVGAGTDEARSAACCGVARTHLVTQLLLPLGSSAYLDTLMASSTGHAVLLEHSMLHDAVLEHPTPGPRCHRRRLTHLRASDINRVHLSAAIRGTTTALSDDIRPLPLQHLGGKSPPQKPSCTQSVPAIARRWARGSSVRGWSGVVGGWQWWANKHAGSGRVGWHKTECCHG